MATASTAPTGPEHGHRFNSQHKLLDPDPVSARSVGALRWSRRALHGYAARAPARRPVVIGRRGRRASAMPKCRVRRRRLHLGDDRRSIVPVARRRSSTRCTCAPIRYADPRGARRVCAARYAGLPRTPVHRLLEAPRRDDARAAVPVHALVSRPQRWLERGCSNYWGYNTIGFFAPDSALLVGRPAAGPGVQDDGAARCTPPASR